MLEQVGVKRAFGQCQIGLDVVVELDQLDGVAVLLQLGDDGLLQHVVVVAGRGTQHQRRVGGVGGLDVPDREQQGGRCDDGGQRGADEATAGRGVHDVFSGKMIWSRRY